MHPLDIKFAERAEKVKAWHDAATIRAQFEMGLTLGQYEIHQGPGGYDAPAVIIVHDDDETQTAILPKNDNSKNDGYLRATDHPRRAYVTIWLRDNDVRWSDFLTSVKSQMARKPLTANQIDAVARTMDKITARDVERVRAATVKPVQSERITQDGMYKMGDDIFKVQVAVHGSGNLYAKRLVVNNYGSATFEYAPGIVKQLTPAMRLTLAEAQEFGHLYGVCCQCGRTLTDEKSIAMGIGPVCAGKI